MRSTASTFSTERKKKNMSQKVKTRGGNGGSIWDDGLNSGVQKVYVSVDDICVTYLKFDYVRDSTKVESHERGTKVQDPQEFVVDYPNEYITSVEGTYANPSFGVVITSLAFKTSKGRTSPTFGNTKFALENNGEKLVGFHGRGESCIEALGAYFATKSDTPKKVEAQGGLGGVEWDDGLFDDVTKVYIGKDQSRVTKVMFDYVTNGVPATRAHGVLAEELDEFLLDRGEHITSVEGTYGKVKGFPLPVVTSLAITTSKGRTSPTYGATKFVLQDNDRHVVGFHGRSGNVIDAIGAYFAPATPTCVPSKT